MKKTLIMILSIFVFITMLTGCGASSKSSESKENSGSTNGGSTAENSGGRIVLIPKTDNSYSQYANLGAQDMAKKNGFQCKYESGPNMTSAKQIELINKAVKEGVNAIVLSAVDPNAAGEAYEKAKQAGVKIVSWDRDVNNEYRSIFVAPGTPEQLGKMLIDMVAGQMPEAKKKEAKIVFHYSSPDTIDQNLWVTAAREYMKKTYPGWKEGTEPYFSGEDAKKAVSVGETVLDKENDADAIICPDSVALYGQAQAAKNLGRNGKVIITGFASPNSMRPFCKDGTVPVFGLWDSKIQGAMGAYIAYWLAQGNAFKVGDIIKIPDVGEVKIQPNTAIEPKAYTAEDSGIVVVPERIIFDKSNIDKYNY